MLKAGAAAMVLPAAATYARHWVRPSTNSAIFIGTDFAYYPSLSTTRIIVPNAEHLSALFAIRDPAYVKVMGDMMEANPHFEPLQFRSPSFYDFVMKKKTPLEELLGI
jgi:hypothetical protein